MNRQKEYRRIWAVEYRRDATGQEYDGLYVITDTVADYRSDSKAAFLGKQHTVVNARKRLWRRLRARTRKFVLVPEDHFNKLKESPHD